MRANVIELAKAGSRLLKYYQVLKILKSEISAEVVSVKCNLIQTIKF